MKKLMMIALVSGFTFTSCGGKVEDKKGDDKDASVSVCDCMKAAEEMGMKMQEDGIDEAKMNEIKEEYSGMMAKCKALGDGLSEEEMAELQKEAENCN